MRLFRPAPVGQQPADRRDHHDDHADDEQPREPEAIGDAGAYVALCIVDGLDGRQQGDGEPNGTEMTWTIDENLTIGDSSDYRLLGRVIERAMEVGYLKRASDARHRLYYERIKLG